MNNVTISTHTPDLFLIPAGDGFSCLGFDVATRWARGVADWLASEGKPCPAVPARIETLEGYETYQAVMAAGSAHNKATGRRCPAQLTPALIGLEGKRIEVTHADGETERYWVGKSTGWLPVHLEIASRRDSGGGCVYLPEGASVRVVDQGPF